MPPPWRQRILRQGGLVQPVVVVADEVTEVAQPRSSRKRSIATTGEVLTDLTGGVVIRCRNGVVIL